MPEAELQYSLNEVKRAGKFLREGNYEEVDAETIIHHLEVFENWQACHSYPMNQFYESLVNHAKVASPLTVVVERRKRLDAVIKKLRNAPNSQLSTMQDIAGVRAITKGMPELESLISRCREDWANHVNCTLD
jgi:putative GTP pyrophosphokinase